MQSDVSCLEWIDGFQIIGQFKGMQAPVGTRDFKPRLMSEPST